jgi:phage shock protein C
MKLCRSTDNRQLAGVCGGLAAELGWSSTRLWVLWVFMALFTGGGGILAYLAPWYLMPKAPAPPQNFEPAVLQPWKKPS